MSVDEVPTDRWTRNATRVLWVTVLLVIAAIPLIVDPRGRDLFRVPKTSFFQAAMLVIGAIAAASALLSDAFAATLVRNRRAVILACSGVAWVAVVSMTSTLPSVSRSAPFSILCYALLFVITVAVARTGSILPALAALLTPAMVNAVIVVLQARDVWHPLGIITKGAARLGNIGLIGNANTAGTYLLVPTIAAFSATAALRRYRLLFAAVTLVLLVGLFETQTITVMFGFTAALLAFVVTGSKRIRILAVAVIVAGICGVLLYTPTRHRLIKLRGSLMRGDYSAVTSNRVPAAAATLEMFLDRPLLGLGPGVFAARYMPHRLAIEDRHPEWIQLARENFGEAHNDHLQVLAETGIPGYALFAIVLISIASFTLRRTPPDDDRGRFVRLFALPAAAGFGAVAIGQFPLELTAVSATCVFAAALCFAWRPDAPR
jgi:O-antigen ligase